MTIIEQINKQSLVEAGIKLLALGIALPIIYISVSGFTSLIGGEAGPIIGGMFGVAELAFILFFPSSLRKWIVMNKTSKIALILIIGSLSLLSFASTHTFITKHMSEITLIADTNNNDIEIKSKQLIEDNSKIEVLRISKIELSSKRNMYMDELAEAESQLKITNQKTREIIYSQKKCTGDCALRRDISLKEAETVQYNIDTTREHLLDNKKLQSGAQDKIDSYRVKKESLQNEISSLEKSRVADENSRNLYEGYNLVGTKLNELLNIDAKPIRTFTSLIAIILYAMYIMLMIWLNTLASITTEQATEAHKRRNRPMVWMRLFSSLRKLRKAKNNKIAELKSAGKKANIEIDTLTKELEQKHEPIQERIFVPVPEGISPQKAVQDYKAEIEIGEQK